MEESWIPYLNVIIAVHDVTAFGNTQVWHPLSLAKFLFYCIYSYQILIIIRSWRNGLLLSFKQFFGKKNYVHIYHMSYHRILRHKITTVHIVTRCLISTLKSTTTSDYRQRIRIGQVLTITRIVNGSYSWPNSPQRQSGRRSFVGTSNTSYSIHTERTKIGLLRLTYRTHTTWIFLEKNGLS